MRLLFLDDEPDNIQFVADTLSEALGAEVLHAATVDDAIELLHRGGVNLVVADVFVPAGPRIRTLLGARSRLPTGQGHLGGLLLLDEIDRMSDPPTVLVHTACNEYAMVEVLKEHGHARVPKPAPVDVLLRACLEALDLPTPG